MAYIVDYAKENYKTGGIRDYISGQFTDGDDGEFVGIGGFKTAATVKERFTRSASVPTTFLEDGSHINDHIIRNPLTISIEGTVSDLFALPSPAIAALQEAQAQIGNISQYAPARTQAQLSRVSGLANDFVSALDKVDSLIESAQTASAYLGLQDKEADSNIENFLSSIAGHQSADSLITISTSFKNYPDMYITSFEATRDNQSKSVSFTMEAQQFRFADTVFVNTNAAENPSSNTNGQTEGSKDKGVQEGKEVPQSVLSSVGYFFGVSF